MFDLEYQMHEKQPMPCVLSERKRLVAESVIRQRVTISSEAVSVT
jgi:hypothetical protein